MAPRPHGLEDTRGLLAQAVEITGWFYLFDLETMSLEGQEKSTDLGRLTEGSGLDGSQEVGSPGGLRTQSKYRDVPITDKTMNCVKVSSYCFNHL